MPGAGYAAQDNAAARVALDRVRWHCRRGLLELDLVLGRFLECHWPQLTAQQRDAFVRLLELPDGDLWDLASGRTECHDPRAAQVVERLREA
jgi:succinate dehydrogenase flavin-adding protein (antitoxin of CptAB toxin-antitoxin module)